MIEEAKLDDEPPEKRPLTEAELRQRREAAQRPRGKNTMTEAALNQRREAAQHSTGPTTDEGKAIASRNAWKHGLYSQASRAMTWQHIGMLTKPCTTSCTQHPCTLVTDGKTKPGGDCLDRTVYVEAFDAIISALHSGDATHSHGLMAAQLAQAAEMLQGLRETIARDGYVIMRRMVDKNGQHIGDVLEPHPVLAHYIKMLDTLGINFAELMLTPRAQEQKKVRDQEKDAFATLMGGLMQRGGGPVKRNTYEGDAEEADDL